MIKFGGAFCLIYFGTFSIIGLSSPGNLYSPFVKAYLNFVDPLRASLLLSSKAFLALFGYKTFLTSEYTLRMLNGPAVRMVYSCIGYGVMSFWGAFIFANNGRWQKKLKWTIGGWIALWLINVLRLSLLLLATAKGWSIPFGWDHHTWFNLAAYALIFAMIYFYDRSSKNVEQKTKGSTFLQDFKNADGLTTQINRIL